MHCCCVLDDMGWYRAAGFDLSRTPSRQYKYHLGCFLVAVSNRRLQLLACVHVVKVDVWVTAVCMC